MKTFTRIISMIPVIIWNGFVVMTLWNWFITTIGIPEIGLVQAIGIDLVLGIMARRSGGENKPDNETIGDVIKLVIKGICLKAYLLGIGYIVHLFI